MTTHGQSKTRLYGIWRSMRGRCECPTCTGYPEYGGRGIKVCDEWHDFMRFHDWAHSNGYRDDLSIDRIDGDGDYSPDNCRWATDYEQMQNRKVALGEASPRKYRIPFQEFDELARIAESNGIRRDTLRFRLTVLDWDRERAVSEPASQPVILTHEGESHTLREWSDITGIPVSTLKWRRRAGWTVAHILDREVTP